MLVSSRRGRSGVNSAIVMIIICPRLHMPVGISADKRRSAACVLGILFVMRLALRITMSMYAF